MICNNCGWNNPDNLNICEKCRQPLNHSHQTQPFAARPTMPNISRETLNYQPQPQTQPQPQNNNQPQPIKNSYHWTTKTILWLITIVGSFFTLILVYTSFDLIGSMARTYSECYHLVEDNFLFLYIAAYAISTVISAILILLKKPYGLHLQLLSLLVAFIFFVFYNFLYILVGVFDDNILWPNVFQIIVIYVSVLILYSLVPEKTAGLQILQLSNTKLYKNILYTLELIIPICWIFILYIGSGNTDYKANNLIFFFLSFVMIIGSVLIFCNHTKLGRSIYYAAAAIQAICIFVA